jgi:hypothetical protein
MHRRYGRILKEVMAERNPEAYRDIAMTPVEAGEEDNLELFTATVSAQEFVQKRRSLAAKREKASA